MNILVDALVLDSVATICDYHGNFVKALGILALLPMPAPVRFTT